MRTAMRIALLGESFLLHLFACAYATDSCRCVHACCFACMSGSFVSASLCARMQTAWAQLINSISLVCVGSAARTISALQLSEKTCLTPAFCGTAPSASIAGSCRGIFGQRKELREQEIGLVRCSFAETQLAVRYASSPLANSWRGDSVRLKRRQCALSAPATVAGTCHGERGLAGTMANHHDTSDL